ncbi:TetR/AcrR family transcriptional regulator [Mycobacterium avium]|uniref:TetR/AcrR family transcriptional regulator n=1 Tax=Mycobacterium avium TaxID=1764 RepID=UPI000A0506AA|nr:TetR/AcrR family transcriptional regulator [Mycobacterium avium]
MALTIRKGKVSRAARREEIAQRVFAAAERLLAEGASFAEISVEQLITGAAIARSTFYVYFEDKGALLGELTERVTQELGEAASAWFTLPSGSTRDDLKAALGTLVGAYRQHRHMLAAVAETAAYDPRVRAQYDRVMERRFEDMNVSFREQQAAGLIRADLDVTIISPWLAWMLDRGLYQLTGDSHDQSDKRLDGMTTVIWQTLYEPSGGGQPRRRNGRRSADSR